MWNSYLKLFEISRALFLLLNYKTNLCFITCGAMILGAKTGNTVFKKSNIPSLIQPNQHVNSKVRSLRLMRGALSHQQRFMKEIYIFV